MNFRGLDTKRAEDSSPTNACSLQMWLTGDVFDRNQAYVPCANGSTMIITQFVNEYFNAVDVFHPLPPMLHF